MILAIFVLAVVLLVSGSAGLISALNLVPTDLGFTYFQASASMLAAGAVILALGLATRVIDRGLSRLAMPVAIRATPLDPLAIIADQQPSDVSSAGNMTVGAMTVGAVAAGTAAATMAGAGLYESISPEFAARTDDRAAGMPDKRLEELERDLFAELESRPASPPVSSDDITALSGEMARSDSPLAEADAGAATPGLSLPRADMGAPFWADAGRSSRPDTGSEPEIERGPDEPPITMPEPPQPDPPVITMPGLIDDADLAAVSDDSLPALAPISTLDVVGSYDSGGTRFTMYSDGSVTTAGPKGESRYRSLEELRRHLDAGTA